MPDSTTPRSRRANASPITWLVAIGTAVASIAVALVGAIVMIGALLLVAFSVLVWALLRGPRLARSRASGPYGRFGHAPTVNKPGQVIDVEVREVHDVHEAHDVDEMPSPSAVRRHI